ncbi:MAG: biotin/lipoyl-containing protein, partial [Actinomycetota bacterium]
DGELTAMASAIGYPVLVKAAAGGGGKGMRVVDEPEQLATAVAGAQREAEAAFGDGTVFLEKYLTASRHVEIQILGDTHGNVVHCHERECSIQRRHQKIIEEAPCTAIAADTASAMGAAAIAAAQAIDYHSAGTVEFLVATEPDGSERFYFLEVNTRLQVEHPVTEEVTGLDLVREQIQVANGEALTFGQDDIELSGHAIEVRLYAEDPDAGFLPATGTLHAFGVDDVPEVRVESGVVSGSVIGTEFDPMLAKVIAHAPTRTEAARKLATALERMTTFGITTNRDHLVRILRHPEFLAGNTTTDFLERVDLPPAGVEPAVRRSLLAAAVVARQAANRAEATALDFMPSGFRNSVMPPERLQYQVDGDEVSVAYRSQRDGTFEVTVEGHETPIVVRHEDQRAPFVQDLSIDGVRSRYTIVRAGRRWYVQGPLGRLESVEVPRFPEPGGDDVAGGQLAPMPGAVRVVAVSVGDEVEAGQPLVVLEAMKMEHTVTAPEAAVVTEVRCTVGDQVDNGAVLVVLEAGSA